MIVLLARAATLLEEVSEHLMTNDMAFVDWDGRVTEHGRFWLLALTGIGMLVIGFYRGDGRAAPLPNLTWDQVLDLVVIGISAGAAAVTARAKKGIYD